MDNTLLGWLFVGGVIVLWLAASTASNSTHKPSTASRENGEDDQQNSGGRGTYPGKAPPPPETTYMISPGVPLDPSGPWAKVRSLVLKRDGSRCVQCGSSDNLTVDHIKELSLGGGNEISNLRTLCKDCHEERHLRRFLDRGFDANDNYGEDTRLSRKIAAINSALKEQTAISIRYKDRYGVRSYRMIHPGEIWRRKKSRKIYLTAYDELDKNERIFRISRLDLSNANTSKYLDTPVYRDNDVTWKNFRDS